MKLVSFVHGEARRLGVVSGDGVVDSFVLGQEFTHLRWVLQAGRIDDLRALESEKPSLGLDEITFLKPVPIAEKIFCIGRNYDEYHEVVEDKKRPEWPSIFPRFNSTFVPHRAPLECPSLSEQFDYEGELVVVIGKAGRHIPEDEALDHVLGYTVGNEGSVRDWQKKGTQNSPGKNFYHSGAIGPWIVTRDEIANPNNVPLKTWVDGELRQDGNTKDMIFHIPFLISHISNFIKLAPGDMISTGSPGGTAVSLEHKPWLKPGQTIEIEFEGVGRLVNPIEAEKL